MAGMEIRRESQVQQGQLVNPKDVKDPKAPGAGVKLGDVGGSLTTEIKIGDTGITGASPAGEQSAPVAARRVSGQAAGKLVESKLAKADDVPGAPATPVTGAKKSVDDVVTEQLRIIGAGAKEISDVDVKALAKKENLDETALTAALTKAGF